MSDQLKQCPCGMRPSRIEIYDGGQGGKYHYAQGSCCGEWMIEFRANYKEIGSAECYELAVSAWNDATRAGDSDD